MKYFKRNGFVALVSMLSLTAYAGDSLPLSVAVSETKEFIQVSGHGIDTSNVIQQERIIQGTVLEEGTNEPLVGVNVVVKGTTIGTTTDIDGKYSIKIPSDKAILVFSYIGLHDVALADAVWLCFADEVLADVYSIHAVSSAVSTYVYNEVW